jgi:hypothetical protein
MMRAGRDYRRVFIELERAQTFARRFGGNPHAQGVFAETPAQTAAYHNCPLIGSRTSILKNFPKLI